MSEDPYVYPGTDILRNVPGIRDLAALERYERRVVTARLEQGVPTGRFDLAHLKAIHRHLFQDLYPWAGEVRTVQISKGNCAFMPTRFVETGMEDVHARLQGRGFLRGMNRSEFLGDLANIIGDVNHVHPFREGNGRTQMQYLKQLCEQADHRIDVRRIDPKRWIDASIAANRADYSVMERTLGRAYTAVDRAREVRMLRREHHMGSGR